MDKIYVKIDDENFDKLIDKMGFLPRHFYPEPHEKFSKEGELGSYLVFRFLKDD